MKKLPELLAPVGSPEALSAAIEAGADAVYLGAHALNARIGAVNFDMDGLAAAINRCHRFGVRAYVTLNTLILDRECEELLATAADLYRMGVDAVINKKLITAGRIFKFTLSNKVRFIKYMSGTNAEVLEYIVAPDTEITKCPLKDMAFPANAIIGGIIRGNESFIAVGDTQIQAYDRVAVFALPEAVKEVDKFFR